MTSLATDISVLLKLFWVDSLQVFWDSLCCLRVDVTKPESLTHTASVGDGVHDVKVKSITNAG